MNFKENINKMDLQLFFKGTKVNMLLSLLINLGILRYLLIQGLYVFYHLKKSKSNCHGAQADVLHCPILSDRLITQRYLCYNIKKINTSANLHISEAGTRQ